MLQYSDQSMVVELTNGEQHILPLNDTSAAIKLSNWMDSKLIQRVQSNEPTLGDIFMQLTGSDLQ